MATPPLNFMRNYKYFEIILALFVAVLLISNIASTKVVDFWKFSFDAGTLLFPLVYIFGDVLTEIYGYRQARKAIWVGFFSLFLLSAILYIVVLLPPAADWPYQDDFKNIFSLTPRIFLASLLAFLLGSVNNAWLMARIKKMTAGKFLWLRTIGSTIAGEAIDTAIFTLGAFLFIMPAGLLLTVMISNYIFKTGVEIVFTPITYKVIGFLRKKEIE